MLASQIERSERGRLWRADARVSESCGLLDERFRIVAGFAQPLQVVQRVGTALSLGDDVICDCRGHEMIIELKRVNTNRISRKTHASQSEAPVIAVASLLRCPTICIVLALRRSVVSRAGAFHVRTGLHETGSGDLSRH